MRSASEDRAISRPPQRPSAMTPIRGASSRLARTACRLASMVASVRSESPRATVSTGATPRTTSTTSRKNSRRRTPRIARIESATSRCRLPTRVISAHSSSRPRGRRSTSTSTWTVSGERTSRSTPSRDPERIAASRCAVSPSSRSARRYHGEDPSSSDTLRKASSPASGFGPEASQPSIAGMSWAWIFTARVVPWVSAAMCRSAADSSAKPNALSRVFAASVVMRSSSEGMRETASTSGE